MSGSIVVCDGITKQFGAVVAVNRVSLAIEKGEIMALIGKSGCGKTTTLRLIAGFDRPDSGTITVAGRQVSDAGKVVPPEQRRIGMVFQNYALFPHLTVAENVAYGLNSQNRAEKQTQVQRTLALVGLDGLEKRMPHELSGGQQQRVALARALAPNPDVILLDEPFSNLDAGLRRMVRDEVRNILRQAGITTIIVTHDQEEALSIADRVAVMDKGEVIQVGTPFEVYSHPRTRNVASFLGDANFIPGTANGTHVTCALGTLPLHMPQQGNVSVMVRPEQIALNIDERGQGNVQHVTFFGHDQLVLVELDRQVRIQTRTWSQPDLTHGTPVACRVQGSVVAFPA
jgi:iron(III) transport system ATP-binding protein